MSDLERFTGGHAVGVDVSAIERDLAALWRKASDSDASVTRACSWNLVVHATGEADLARGKALADALVEVVPTRTLVLSHQPDGAGPEVEAFVTANCRKLPGGGKLVCTEEITVEARGRGGDHLPSLLRALVVPDLPTALLWAGLPPAGALVQELLPGMDRLVFDSGAATENAGLARVTQLSLPRHGPALVDLAWLRLAQLRQVLASAFDPPIDAALAWRLSRVRVTCAPDAVPATRLLAGWLASRLGWTSPERLSDRELPGYAFQRPQGRVQFDVYPCETALHCGIGEVTFEAEGGEEVQVRMDHGGLSVSGPGVTFRTPAHERDDRALIVAALGSQGVDPVYDGALRRAVELERA